MGRKEIAQDTQADRKKASQENWSRVAGIQNIADMQKGSVLERLGIASMFQENKGIFSSFRSLLIERAFIMLTL